MFLFLFFLENLWCLLYDLIRLSTTSTTTSSTVHIFYRHISTSNLMDIIISEHNRLQTFVVKTSSSPSSPVTATQTKSKDGLVGSSSDDSSLSSTLNRKKSKSMKPKLLY